MEAEIDTHIDALKGLKVQKKEIQKKIADREKDEVYQVFLKSGKSIEDVISLLSDNEK